MKKMKLFIAFAFLCLSAGGGAMAQMVTIFPQAIGNGNVYYNGKNASSILASVGDSITLNAVPDNDWHFVEWLRLDSVSSETVGMNENYTFEATVDVRLAAKFEQNRTQQYVNIALQTTGNGNIYYNGKNASSMLASVGDSITLNAVPDDNWHFVEWLRLDSVSSETVGINENYTFEATVDINILAVFEQNRTQPIASPKVKFNHANLSLKPEERETLTLLVNGVPATAFNWNSSDNAIASVSQYGEVTGLALGGKAEITARIEIDSTMYSAHCMVYVEEQTIMIEEAMPVTDGTGTTEVALEIPSQMPFTGSFEIELPVGVSINTVATQIASAWSDIVSLQIVPMGDGVWKFVFTINMQAEQHAKLRAATPTNKIVDIVYEVAETVTEDFDLVIKDLSLTLDDEDNTVITRDETVVPVALAAFMGIGVTEPDNYPVLRVHPNPAKDILYIDIPYSQNVEYPVMIWDLSGRTVGTKNFSPLQNSVITIGISHLPKGVYIVKVGDYRGKFVKK
jgi:hypothetical protein